MVVADLSTKIAKLKKEITMEKPTTMTGSELFLFLKR
jgi:hypothetical protein